MLKPLVVIALLTSVLALAILPALAQAPMAPGGSSTDIGAGTSTDAGPADRATNSIVVVAVVLAVVAIIVAMATRKKPTTPAE